MRKILLVYYSFEGNTEYAANIAAKCADMDVQRLIPIKEPPKKGFGKFFWGGKSVMMKEMPDLEPQEYSAADYDTIILGFPVWASSYPPAIATFLRDNDLTGKNIYVIACSAGGDAQKALRKLAAKLRDSSVKTSLSLQDPLKNQADADKKIPAFIKTIV